jgi:hypothetical protein
LISKSSSSSSSLASSNNATQRRENTKHRTGAKTIIDQEGKEREHISNPKLKSERTFRVLKRKKEKVFYC